MDTRTSHTSTVKEIQRSEKLTLSDVVQFIRNCGDGDLDVIEHAVRASRGRSDPAVVLPTELFDRVLTSVHIRDLGAAGRVSK